MRKRFTSLLCGLAAVLLLAAVLPTAALAASGAQDPMEEQAQTVPGRQWRREKQDAAVSYYGPKGAGNPRYDRPPAYRPTWLPEGWALDSTFVPDRDRILSQWHYCKGEAQLQFTCYLRSEGYLGMALYDWNAPLSLRKAAPAVALQQVQVQGRDADFFQAGSCGYLVWEDSGNLFTLRGELDRASLVRMADSVREVSDQTLPEFRPGWEPEGPKLTRRDDLPGAVMLDVEKDLPDYINVPFYTLLYTAGPLCVPAGEPETAEVNGTEARFWKGVQRDRPVTIWPTREEMNTLVWTDPETQLTFRLQGPLERDVLLRMARSLARVDSGSHKG